MALAAIPGLPSPSQVTPSQEGGIYDRIDLEGAPVIPVTSPGATKSPLEGNRVTRYRFDLLDSTGKKFGELDGVSGGSITWNANSAVKGGGKISVAKSSLLHEQEIRVVNNLPTHGFEDFETDNGGFAVKKFHDWYSDPISVQRVTAGQYEGAGALEVQWGDRVGATDMQAINNFWDGLQVGSKYTIVAKVLNTTEESLYLGDGSLWGVVRIPPRNDWQTVAYTFTADSTSVWPELRNEHPAAGRTTLIDNFTLYFGETTGFNGEAFSYAPFTWSHARIRPVLMIDGVPEEPLGVFVAAAPASIWDETGGREEIELLDRTSILDQDYLTTTYTVKAGTNIIAAVKKLIASTGESVGSLTDSDETLPSTLTWGAGKNKLTVINELLDAAGYFALWTDGAGQFRVEKYQEPRKRPVAYEMLDNSDSIYLPSMTVDNDLYSTPNRVVMTAQGDGESEGWTAVATNENPESRYSFQGRGRWITDVQLGVEATSQEDLQSKANRRLASLASNRSTLTVNHGPLPGLLVNNVIHFRRRDAAVDSLFTITSTTINFDPTELQSTSITEVVAL